MIKKIKHYVSNLSWKSKLVLGISTAIFFTFFLFSYLQYHVVSKWMLKQEENSVEKIASELYAFYREKGNSLSADDIKNSHNLLVRLNDKDQLIRVYDEDGKVLTSDLNGNFAVMEPFHVQKNTLEYVNYENTSLIVIKRSINTPGFKGTLEIDRMLNSYHRLRKNLFWAMTIFGIAAMVLSALSGFLLSKQLLKPMKELSLTMKKIKQEGFQERMPYYHRKDEISDISQIFNEMMDDIELAFQQQKQFIEDASHELRTPISILEGHLSLLNRWGKRDPEILEESLQASYMEVTRLKKLVLNLLDLSRAENMRIDSVITNWDIKSAIHETVENFRLIHPDNIFEVDFKFLGSEVITNRILEQHFVQILIILLDNAVKYSDVSKVVNIVVETIEDEGKLVLSVKDKGIGIPDKELGKIFNRFYRVDKARTRETGGSGLGLPIAKKLVEQYKGTISIDSKEGEGTKVTVVLSI